MKWNKALISLIVLAMGGPLLSAQAQNADSTHTVTAGETLFSIARQYEADVEQIRSWNNLSGNELSVGQTLIVRKGLEQEGDIQTHEVQTSETLFSISKQYGVTIPEIKTWNNLDDNSLEIGQKLIIHTFGSQGSSSAGGSSSEKLVVTTEGNSNTYYTVKSGDTLYQIAAEHNMTVNELKALNDLSSNTIRLGQSLTVRKTRSAPSVAESESASSPQGKFITYRVQEQQSLKSLLDRFNMTEAEFKALNPDQDSNTFRTGQSVTVLAPPSRVYKNPYTIQGSLKNLGETAISAYSTSQTGTTTTSGELYNPEQLTAAHSNIALGDVIFVKNPETEKGIYLRVNDRYSGNGLKLSEAALEALGLTVNSGATVSIYQDQ